MNNMKLASSFLEDFLDFIWNTTLSISMSDINIPTLLTYSIFLFMVTIFYIAIKTDLKTLKRTEQEQRSKVWPKKKAEGGGVILHLFRAILGTTILSSRKTQLWFLDRGHNVFKLLTAFLASSPAQANPTNSVFKDKLNPAFTRTWAVPKGNQRHNQHYDLRRFLLDHLVESMLLL